jgi:hypothetical protein
MVEMAQNGMTLWAQIWREKYVPNIIEECLIFLRKHQGGYIIWTNAWENGDIM